MPARRLPAVGAGLPDCRPVRPLRVGPGLSTGVDLGPQATERQRAYAGLWGSEGVYTPQLVAGGRHQAVGSDRAETLELPAGHVGLVIGRAAATMTLPRLYGWLREHSDVGGEPVSEPEETT